MNGLIRAISEGQSASTLLLTIVIILGFHLIFAVFRFLWGEYQEKDKKKSKDIKSLSETVTENTRALVKLENELNQLGESVSEMNTIKSDISRMFTILKSMAGEKWPEVRDDAVEDQNVWGHW